MSTPRSARSRRWASGKSSPTAATRRTWVKKLAEYEKYVAEPPSASCTLPKGVSTLSSATEPTTRRSPTTTPLGRLPPAPLARKVLVEQEPQALRRPPRDRLRMRDDRIPQEARALARAPRADGGDRRAQHVLGGRDVLQEVPDDRLDRHRLVRLVPDVVVGRERERRVAELRLAGKLRLGHVRHADHVHAPAPVDPRLRLRRELRPLDTDVGAAPVHRGARLAGRLLERGRKVRADRLRHADVGQEAVAEEGGGPPLRRVEELVGDDQVERADRVLHAPDGGDRDDPFRAERLEPPDVGAEVELARHDAVAAPVARQEDHAPVEVPPGAERVGGLAEGRPHAAPPDVGEPRELVEPAAPDDADGALGRAPRHHATSPSVRSRSTPVTRTRVSRPMSPSAPSNCTST